MELRAQVLLSAQKALLGEIYPAIRAIVVGFSDQEITIRFYFDRIPTEDDFENASVVATEMIADFSREVKHECIFTSEPQSKLDPLNAWVYSRKESIG